MWLVLPAIFIAAVLSFLLYYKDKKLEELNKILVYSLIAIRFIVLFFVSFLLLSPVIKYLQNYFDNPIIILAQDKSESIGLIKQGIISPTDYYKNIGNFEQTLAKGYDVKSYSFGENLKEGLDLKFIDKETDFTPLFEEINSKYVNYNVGALIIATDGIYNKGQNPVYNSKDFSFPVYIIALGDTIQKKDLIVRNAFSNKIAFLGDYFPIEVSINGYGFQNEDINLLILSKGKEIIRQTIHIDRNDFYKQINFDLLAEQKGIQNYIIKIENKKDEFDLLNNSKEIIVDVVDDKKKILILANSVHPDIGALRKALESNKNLLIESFIIDDFKGNITDYQLVIFHQLPSLHYNIQKVFNQLNQAFVPALFIVGSQTDIQTFNQLKTGISITGNNRLLEQSIALVNPVFKLFEIDEKLIEYIRNCPPLVSPFGNYIAENQIDVLFSQQIKGIVTQKPLLCFSLPKPGVRGKYAFLMGDGIWRWRMNEYLIYENHIHFDAMLNKIVHFLALDVQKDRFMVHHNKIFKENEDIIFRAEFYNQSYELNNSSDVSFRIYNADNKEYKYQFSKTAKSYQLNTGRLPLGNYNYLAKIEFEGKEYRKNGEFRISEINIEHQDLTANHSILNQIAVQTNGKMFYPNELDKLLNEIKNKETIRPISHTLIDLVDLIELKWVFFMLVVLLSTEWFLRKFFGSY